MDDDCCSPEAQGRGKSRKIESGLLPQFRIPVQTGAVARPLRAERCQRTVYSRKGAPVYYVRCTLCTCTGACNMVVMGMH